jgi:hypothetical protein
LGDALVSRLECVGVASAVVTEDDPEPTAAFFEECHRVLPENRKGADNRRIRNVNAMLFPKSSQQGERNETRVYADST